MNKNFLIVFTILFLALVLGSEILAQDKNNLNKNETKSAKQEDDRDLKIKKKPRANSSQYCSQTSGTTKLKIIFDKSAKIAGIELYSSSGCKDFDRNAFEAAKSIKFDPALKNGEPITVTKIIEYTFTVY